MDEASKALGRAVAGNAFQSTTKTPNIPTIAQHVLRPIKNLVEEWERNTPPEMHLVVFMRAADGNLIDVERLRTAGGLMFQAEGKLDGKPCMILAHVEQLNMFLRYEDNKGRARIKGFVVEVPESKTLPVEALPKASENK